MIFTRSSRVVAALAAATLLGTAASAADRLKVATGQRGNFDTSIGEIGTRAGIFKKYGLELDILYTQGGGETQQAVISGSVDIGVAAGIMGVIGAYAKGAPVRIIGAQTTGAGDLFWYVRSDSPIKSLKDTDGKTIAFSTKGSSTDGIVNAFMKEYSLKAKPTATGSPATTLTQVLSGQIDAGWSSPPFGFEQMDKGQIRKIASGNDASVFKGQTVRLLITHVQDLKDKKDLIDRYMKAYTDPKAMDYYAEFIGVTPEIARRTRDDYFPRSALEPDKIVGLDLVMPDAVEMKYIAAPLTRAQIDDMIQIPPR